VRQRPKTRVAQERVIEEIAISVQVAEDWLSERILFVDHDTPGVDWKPFRIRHQIARRRVDELQRRAVVAEFANRFELIRVRIRRARRNLPSAPWKGRLHHVHAGQSAQHRIDVRFQNESWIGSSFR